MNATVNLPYPTSRGRVVSIEFALLSHSDQPDDRHDFDSNGGYHCVFSTVFWEKGKIKSENSLYGRNEIVVCLKDTLFAEARGVRSNTTQKIDDG